MNLQEKLAEYKKIYEGFSSNFRFLKKESVLKFKESKNSFYDDEEAREKKAQYENYKENCEKLAQKIQNELNEMGKLFVEVEDGSLQGFEKDWEDANEEINDLRDKIKALENKINTYKFTVLFIDFN